MVYVCGLSSTHNRTRSIAPFRAFDASVGWFTQKKRDVRICKQTIVLKW